MSHYSAYCPAVTDIHKTLQLVAEPVASSRLCHQQGCSNREQTSSVLVLIYATDYSIIHVVLSPALANRQDGFGYHHRNIDVA